MSETKDAKYFGARIGEKCWYDDCICIITSISMENDYFVVEVKITEGKEKGDSDWAKRGEGITFEAPKKKVPKSIDGFINHHVTNFNSIIFLKEKTGEVTTPAKISWLEEE